MFVDTHCHLTMLDLTPYDGNLDLALAQAREAGVSKFMSISVDLDDHIELAKIAARHADVGYTVGVHPCEDAATMARATTDYLVELAGEGAKTAELEGVNGASATIDRGEGFHSVADEKLDVVASQTANFNRAEGMTVMENMLQANPDIQCVFAHNDEMALGAIEAIGDKEIIVAGFDATDDAIEAVKEGTMAATVAQQPDLMGATAVETATKLMAGETVEKTLPVEVSLITKDNVE